MPVERGILRYARSYWANRNPLNRTYLSSKTRTVNQRRIYELQTTTSTVLTSLINILLKISNQLRIKRLLINRVSIISNPFMASLCRKAEFWLHLSPPKINRKVRAKFILELIIRFSPIEKLINLKTMWLAHKVNMKAQSKFLLV